MFNERVYMKELNIKLAAIQKELKAPKSQVNNFAHFNYRSCEDILEAVKPLLGTLVLTITDEVELIGDRYYVKATAMVSDGENDIKISSYAREGDTKAGMDVAQITGSASSYARKYALNGLFAIDDTKDADTQDNSKKEEPKKFGTATSLDPYHKSYKGRVVAKTPVEDDIILTDKELLSNAQCEVCGKEISRKIEEYSKDKYGKVLCMAHQLKEKSNEVNTD